MYRLFDLIRAVRAACQPYQVCVAWGLDAYDHKAWTFADALAWSAQYPADADIWIKTRLGRLLSFRSGRVAAFGMSAYR